MDNNKYKNPQPQMSVADETGKKAKKKKKKKSKRNDKTQENF